MRGFLLVVGVLGGCGRIAFEPRDDAGGPGVVGDAPDTDAASDAATLAPNRAFVTSIAYTANLGGLAGADARCQERADAALRGGTFVALLRTTAEPAFDRLAGFRGWVDLRGRPIVDLPMDWVGGLIYPLNIDETGAMIAGSEPVFRGRAEVNSTCADWTSASAISLYERVATAEAMTSESFINCMFPARLACVERRVDVAIPPPQETGRLAFLSQGQWTSSGGLASADAFCQGEATGAGLPGTYRAVLHSSGGPPTSRFAMTGAPWRRVDGPRLAPTTAAVFAQSQDLDTFPVRTAGGAVATTNGVALQVARGTPAEHCTDWTATTGDLRQATAASVLAGAFQGEESTRSSTCGFVQRLVCFQE